MAFVDGETIRQIETAELEALAHVGIIALIDEATGYQEKREEKELLGILIKSKKRKRKTPAAKIR